MASYGVDEVTAALESTRVTLSGVTFEGKSLKLNTEEDAQPVVDAIASSINLEYLNLEGNTLGVDAARAISKALEKHPEFKRALWKDMFTGRMKTEIPKALQFLGDGLVAASARLTELDMSDNAFGPIGVQGLASLLRSSSCYALEELRLNNNGLGITGGKLLAKALLDCYTASKGHGNPLALKVFVAGRNRLENDGAKALAEVFKTIGTLEEIAMPQNGIYHIGISALSVAFTHNKNLQILNLNDNTIGPKGAEAIAKALPNLQNLKYINFGDCLLKTKGAVLLADALKDGHTTLEELSLGYNEIRGEGGLTLVNAMKNKVKLKSLVLDGNQFNEGIKIQLKNKLREIGKLNVMESLDECESEDSDADEDENNEDVEEEQSEEEVDSTLCSDMDKSLMIEPTTTKVGTVENFSAVPSIENFLSLGHNRVDVILKEIKKNPDVFLETSVPLIMKISSLSNQKQDQVAIAANKCTESLYKELFAWAQENRTVSLVNNSLLVHLGLLKSEDKKFKPTWNIEQCLLVLENVLQQNYVPASTRDTIKVFMGREIENNAEHLKTKTRLLKTLENCIKSIVT